MYVLRSPVIEPAPDEPAFSLTVYGIPGPQGSKTVKGKRRTTTGKLVPNLVESSKKVKPWRDAVEDAAKVRILLQRGRFVKLDGPLEAAMFFTLPAPQKMPKDRVAATVYPDLSKLLRSTEDALTKAGVWADDARVIGYRALRKTYTSLGPHALARPGVTLHIWKATP
ncbi:RusA family crossover junction endodeoxyribonuclease [Streptomyces scabiei]|uniref:RusA family crossover junction endodeoxyribonuclease n=1 Tax=Streptomyces scabiei TaxID=1930 RepID=UPI0027E1247A|nr:RusA family crossover junction endodeoxyribonuclease [Streptomyces sp. LBUM 1483]